MSLLHVNLSSLSVLVALHHQERGSLDWLTRGRNSIQVEQFVTVHGPYTDILSKPLSLRDIWHAITVCIQVSDVNYAQGL